MRTCSQQAAAAYQLHRAAFSIPIAAPVHYNTQHAVMRLPRSPPTSPRHLDPTDPELVRQLRAFLSRAAQRPPGVSHELEQLLLCKLAISTQELEEVISSSSMAEACSRSNGDSSIQQSQLQELESGLDHLLQLFSPAEVFHLIQQQPALLFAPLASWCEFFVAYGFSSSQIKNLISQTRGEVLTKGTLVTAGDAIMHLKALGFDNDEIRHRVVAYCPQVLAMSVQDIDVLIRLWAKFKVGVDERVGM